MKKNSRKKIIDIGWREWVELVDFDNLHFKAKIDTGATMSALHATHIKEFERNKKKYVEFRLHQTKSYKKIKKPILGYKTIKNSFGKKQSRPLIYLSIKLGDDIISTIITLAKRSNMVYPVLIGRSTLAKNYRINPKKSYLTGKLN